MALPEAQQRSEPWQAAVQAMLIVADRGAASMAEIGVRIAVNGPLPEPVFDTNAKMTHWGKRRKNDDRWRR